MLKVNKLKIERAIRNILLAISENPDREGLKDTPKRMAKFYEEFLNKEKDFIATTFTSQYDEMVIVKDIPFYSLCEHHLLPFFGKIKIGYIPKGKILGLSKLVRIADKYCRRLQIQEKLVEEIAKEIKKTVKPSGVGVVIEAEHLCMSMRGIKKPSHKTITSCLLGCFKRQEVREEFIRL